MKKVKSFLYITVAIGILIFTFEKLYKHWAFAERRKQADRFYTNEFQYAIKSGLNHNDFFSNRQLYNTLKNLENKMIYDGYTHVEIGAIVDQAAILARQDEERRKQQEAKQQAVRKKQAVESYKKEYSAIFKAFRGGEFKKRVLFAKSNNVGGRMIRDGFTDAEVSVIIDQVIASL